MVDRDVLLRKAVDKLCDSTASLKVEQRDAVVSLLDGHDVLAVLPTGFGKSLIFQAFILAAEMERERLQTASGNKTSTSAFREAFGRLSTLRSFCQQGTPVLAITGTADDRTQDVIIKQLGMKHVRKIYVSPNRPNLRISVVKCKKEMRFKQLAWLVSLLKEKGIYTPKTIIFCNGTLTDIAVVLNHLLLELGKSAYSPCDDQSSDNCLIGIYHSLTLHKYKDRIIKSFKGEGKKRVVIASTALSMGVNFPDVRYVIHWGPARNLLDYHQESGRGGRDGKQTQVLTIYYGQQVSFCEQDVKNFSSNKCCAWFAQSFGERRRFFYDDSYFV
ncbi:PREDICTED: ATP-dependent DNA helicase RecQ-like [Acropora digitifera]|uniref:ATP-dependent DNA helicase RecQ-like n=1 Tax=Acropora digitifera TaxID=70779 RepID=UPI00077AF56F|nr:PREDICTED: ATP-dependent DNA helicase RecQ-like [Acropora digitifera]